MGVPIYFGDALFPSNTRPPDQTYYLPAFDDIKIVLSKKAERYVTGAVQKLNILSDRLLVAWRRQPYASASLVGGSDGSSREWSKIQSDIAHVFNNVDQRDRDRVSLLGTLLVPDKGRTGVINFGYGDRGRWALNCWSMLRGRGAQSFMDVPNSIPAMTTTEEANARLGSLVKSRGACQLADCLLEKSLATGGKF